MGLSPPFSVKFLSMSAVYSFLSFPVIIVCIMLTKYYIRHCTHGKYLDYGSYLKLVSSSLYSNQLIGVGVQPTTGHHFLWIIGIFKVLCAIYEKISSDIGCHNFDIFPNTRNFNTTDEAFQTYYIIEEVLPENLEKHLRRNWGLEIKGIWSDGYRTFSKYQIYPGDLPGINWPWIGNPSFPLHSFWLTWGFSY